VEGSAEVRAVLLPRHRTTARPLAESARVPASLARACRRVKAGERRPLTRRSPQRSPLPVVFTVAPVTRATSRASRRALPRLSPPAAGVVPTCRPRRVENSQAGAGR